MRRSFCSSIRVSCPKFGKIFLIPCSVFTIAAIGFVMASFVSSYSPRAIIAAAIAVPTTGTTLATMLGPARPRSPRSPASSKAPAMLRKSIWPRVRSTTSLMFPTWARALRPPPPNSLRMVRPVWRTRCSKRRTASSARMTARSSLAKRADTPSIWRRSSSDVPGSKLKSKPMPTSMGRRGRRGRRLRLRRGSRAWRARRLPRRF